MTPRLMRIARGWLAIGDGWAVDAPTEEEARQRFAAAEARHRELDNHIPQSSAPDDCALSREAPPCE